MPAAAFRLDLCAGIRGPVPKNTAGVVAGTIPGGRRAVLRLTGAEEGMEAAFAWLCGVWLPRSGEKRADLLLYCQRVAFPPAVAPEATRSPTFICRWSRGGCADAAGRRSTPARSRRSLRTALSGVVKTGRPVAAATAPPPAPG